MPFFFSLFGLWPIVEIIVFVMAAKEIGVFSALFLMLLSATLGGFIIRNQGFATLLSLRTASRSGRMPADVLFDSLCMSTAGLLFMIPGFLSDVAALALLVPAARRHLRAYIQDNTELFSQKKGQNSDILEGEFERVEEDAPKITSDRT